ncbi:hypothetical protein [Prosthecobacter fusiformis]|nr:hypothetical protein [Prosthecobacter fusiformis]
MATVDKREYYESNSAVQLPARIGGARIPLTRISSHQNYTYFVDGREYRGKSVVHLDNEHQFEIRYSKANPGNSGIAGAAIRDGLSQIAVGIVFYFGVALLFYCPIYMMAKIRHTNVVTFKDFWFS